MKIISKKDFDKRIVKEKKDAAVLFFKPNCELCDRMEEAAYGIDCVEIYKVNVECESQLTSQNAVMSVPTIVYFKSGEPVARSIGVKMHEEIEKTVTHIYR